MFQRMGDAVQILVVKSVRTVSVALSLAVVVQIKLHVGSTVNQNTVNATLFPRIQNVVLSMVIKCAMENAAQGTVIAALRVSIVTQTKAASLDMENVEFGNQ
jgi:hypothetical protein